MKTFYSNGKLLITAEYLVLDGANALALPTKFGQSLQVASQPDSGIHWQSFTCENDMWLDTHFSFTNNTLSPETENDLTVRLASILNTAKALNPKFLSGEKGLSVKTHLDFPTNWGLGTSSTLINNIANWAEVDPYKLLALTFGGSGYDIACASNNTPILYKLEETAPTVKVVSFKPSFYKHIYFVHLNIKQNSRDGIAHYKSNRSNKSEAIKAVNSITEALLTCTDLDVFNTFITAHEAIIAELVKLKPVKTSLFPDFVGSVKSLGAWGGDFVMVASAEDPTTYFKQKGYHTILSYQDMIL